MSKTLIVSFLPREGSNTAQLVEESEAKIRVKIAASEAAELANEWFA